jgi:hypothetical protein
MLCPNCSKLAFIKANKTCIRCQGVITINIAVICEFCSKTEKKCAVCAKTIITEAARFAQRGCNCGRK